MKRRSLFVLLLSGALSAGFAAIAAAHPGHGHSEQGPASIRTWKDASGTFELEASFVAVADTNVQLRKSDGLLLSVALERLSDADRRWVVQRQAEIRRLNVETPQARGVPMQVAADDEADGEELAVNDAPATRKPGEPAMHAHFQPFAETLKLRWDDEYYYVGSNGMPEHPMMIGIRAWQQQVPLPQKYFDDNAWRIPLHPKPAAEPASAKGRFLRGAIALAVNGVPIFNPLNNRGDDAYLFGELDEWGGHCGRADDYHYHVAPVHLEKTVGRGSPIAYALDGYPIYGYDEADGSKVAGLDWLNGHKDAAGNYHYHATKTYPYLNGGFYGDVVERDGQVDPQPRAQPVREFLPPLQGAKITDFKSTQPGSYELTYDVDGKLGYVRYTIAASGAVDFTFVDTAGKTTTETYTSGRRPGGGGERSPRPGQPDAPAGRRPPPRPGNAAPLRDENIAPPTRSPAMSTTAGRLDVSSAAIGRDGKLPKEFTCDGSGISPPIAWSGAPVETKSFAVSLWHTAPDREKSYWVVYDIPPGVASLAKNSRDVGRLGQNDKGRADYDPMCSKGPGVKEYHITVYALSAPPDLANVEPTRANLLAAIRDTTLASGTLTYRYRRDE